MAMTFSKAQQEFQIRYYLWAVSEFEKERNESFADLRLFKAGPAWKFYQFVEQLSGNEQKIFGAGRLKKFHPNAVQVLGEKYSDDEKALLLRFDGFRREVSVPNGEASAGEKVKFASKRKLRKVMTAKFKEAFGGQCLGLACVDEDPELQFKMKIGGWIFDTVFDFGRSESQIHYWHDIVSETTIKPHGIPAMMMVRFVSLCFWLGVCSQTQWKYLMDEDVEPACDAAIKFCGCFFEVAPKLLKGLEFEKISEESPSAIHT